jgi:hypothetical protein
MREYLGTEKPVAALVLSLPQDSFIRSYVELVTSFSDTHIAHHLVGALSVMSQLVPPYIGFPFGGTPIRANFFGLLVGSSGSRKTVAVSLAKRVLERAGLSTAAQPASREAFIDSLKERQKTLVAYTEFGDFLATSAAASYLAPMRTALNDAADCSPLTREKVSYRKDGTEKKDIRGHQNPRVSLLAATAPNFLNDHTTETDWAGGFFARFFITDYEREYDDMALPEDGGRRLDDCARYVQLANFAWNGHPGAHVFGQCGGFTPDARERYVAWVKAHDQPLTSSAAIAAAANRYGPHAIKIALLLAWDAQAPRVPWSWNRDANVEVPYMDFRGVPHQPYVCCGHLPLAGDSFCTYCNAPTPWLVRCCDVDLALRIIELVHCESFRTVSQSLASTREERLVVSVQRALSAADQARKALTVGELSAELRRGPNEIDQALYTLRIRKVANVQQRADVTDREWFLTRGILKNVIEMEQRRIEMLAREDEKKLFVLTKKPDDTF